MSKIKTLVLFLLFCGATAEARPPIRIVILDSGYIKESLPNLKVCENGEYDLTGTGIRDNQGHGTNIAGIIEERLKEINYCVYIVKYWDPNIIPNRKIYFNALLKVHDLHPDIVNFSSGGPTHNYFEENFIDEMTTHGATEWIVAAGNESTNLDKNCNFFPGCYPYVINVGSRKDENHVSKFSNYGKRVKRWANGEHVKAGGVVLSGTSQATAIVTTEIVLEMVAEKK